MVDIHVLIRFGRWDTILSLSFPDDKKLFCCRQASLHYARGIAYAALAQINEAKTELACLEILVDNDNELHGRLVHNNTAVDILRIAIFMLRGEISYRSQQFDEAFENLKKAVSLEDSLAFDEPWGWVGIISLFFYLPELLTYRCNPFVMH